MAISYTFPEEPPLKKSFVTTTVTEVSDSDEETPLLKSEDTQSCQARAHTEFEHSLDFWSALRVYRPAVFWCIIVNVTIVLNGFDGALMGNLVGVKSFKQQFGHVFGEDYIISAAWLGAFNYAPMLGAALGSFSAGIAYDNLGPRTTLGLCSFSSINAVFIMIFSTTSPMLFLGQLINGTIVGFFPVIASAFVGEVCPVVLRGVIGSMVNLGFVTGQLLAAALLKATATLDSHWAYNIPFIAQFFLPILILALLPFMPESPWYLVRQGRTSEAKCALFQLSTTDVSSQNALSSILCTIDHEKSYATSGQGPSIFDAFRGPDLRRLIISIMVFQLQPLSGSTLYISYSVYFFEILGLSSASAFTMKLYLTIMGFLGTILAWPIMSALGRRPILITGSATLAFLLFLIGAFDMISAVDKPISATYIQASLVVLANFIYDLSTGPLCFVILTEMPSPKTRGLTLAISNVCAAATNVFFAVGIPFLLNRDQANWDGKVGFLFAVTGVMCTGWCWLCLPESKGRTSGELDVLFEREVDSRRFEGYDIARVESEEDWF